MVDFSRTVMRLLLSGVLAGILFVCAGVSALDGSTGSMTVSAAEKGMTEMTETDGDFDPETETTGETDTDAGGGESADDTLCIVIDPGHGGENLGGEYEDYTEKEMTIVVARAMKEELEQYEGVTVYLTRDGDQELSLDERCEFAEHVGADFLFCLHFNMSEHHTLFGAECWVSAFGENYSKGYGFASVEMELLQELGLYSRGIKTRLNDRGTDYYGIIRHATERDIPCVLIEHCHLDQENDKPYYDHDEKLKAFGRLNATAAAKYFNLRSDVLGVDYNDYQNVAVDVPEDVVEPDRTEPDFCSIEVLEQNADTGEVTVQVSAADSDSGMLYYTYSYNGGMTFSELQRWPDKTRDTFEFTLTVPSGMVPQIIVNAYNGYDLYTASNTLSLPSMNYETELAGEADEIAEETEDAVESASDSVLAGKADNARKTEKEKNPLTMGYFLQVCLFCALLVFAMAFSMTLILRSHKRRRRRRRK